eukprot:15455433-Alexandrium_andersonii.AAC.1
METPSWTMETTRHCHTPPGLTNDDLSDASNANRQSVVFEYRPPHCRATPAAKTHIHAVGAKLPSQAVPSRSWIIVLRFQRVPMPKTCAATGARLCKLIVWSPSQC